LLDRLQRAAQRARLRLSHWFGRRPREHAHSGLKIPRNAEELIGQGDFLQIGEEFKRYFIDLAGLEPDYSILDVGCGLGRMALPLTDYLDRTAEYQGLDIVAECIDWCQKHISTRYDHFHFQHIDVINGHYNCRGQIPGTEFNFPFEQDHFDRIIVISVFTHMLQQELRHYLLEIGRVLKPGGKCLCTAFLLNEDSRALIKSGASTQKLQSLDGQTAVASRADPEASIGCDQHYFLDTAKAAGLAVSGPIHYGAWCGRSEFLSYRDIVVLEKAAR
jgi:SAM-dependent methyltransferase